MNIAFPSDGDYNNCQWLFREFVLEEAKGKPPTGCSGVRKIANSFSVSPFAVDFVLRWEVDCGAGEISFTVSTEQDVLGWVAIGLQKGSVPAKAMEGADILQMTIGSTTPQAKDRTGPSSGNGLFLFPIFVLLFVVLHSVLFLLHSLLRLLYLFLFLFFLCR